MNIDCLSCGREVKLTHAVFNDYKGAVKCFCCGALMEITTKDGVLGSADLLADGIIPYPFQISERSLQQR